MLLVSSSFLLKYAVRNYIYLFNPVINNKDDIVLPKQTILHLLDLDSESMFISKNSYYFNAISSNKKIAIYNVNDLSFKEGNPILLEKQLNTKIKKWERNNLKDFRPTNIFEQSKADDISVNIINYNAIKHMYKYPSNLLSKHNSYYNLKRTYIGGVKQIINNQPSSINFINIKIPHMLYSYNIFVRMANMNELQLMRVVKEDSLLDIFQLFLWFNPKTRNKSSYNVITDEDTNNIILNFEYKDKIIFIPFNVLASLSKDSPLDNKTKLTIDKLQKLFIVSLLRVQSVVEKELEQNTVLDITDDSITITDNSPDNDLDDNEQNNQNELEYTKHNKYNIKNNTIKPEDINPVNLTELINEYDESEIDNLFIEDINEDINEDSVMSFNANDDEIIDLIKDKTKEETYNKYIEQLINSKSVSSAEIRTIKKQIADRKELKSPYNINKQIDEDTIIKPEDTNITKEEKVISVNNNLVNSVYKENILGLMDKKYINNVLYKDILACVLNLEKANIIVKSYDIDKEKSLLGNYEYHRVVLKPLDAKESIIYFKLPKINEDGTFLASAVRLKLRKQKSDLPIRKISEIKVALTSNYCKLFIAATERKAYNYLSYITNYIKEDYISESPLIIKHIELGNSFDNSLNLPIMYSNLSMTFNNIVIANNDEIYTLNLVYTDISKHIDIEVQQSLEKRSLFYIGYNKASDILVIDNNDIISVFKNNTTTPIGKIETLLNLDNSKIPTTFSTIKILGTDIPLGVAIAYYIGIEGLIKICKGNPIIMESNKKYKLSEDEFQLRFKDNKLIFKKSNKEATLLLSGFLFYKDLIRQYNIIDFNKPDIYLLVMEERSCNLMHLKELGILKDLFLDPITIDVLKEMKEPTNYLELLLRANNLLTTLEYPKINDMNYSRIKGYERIAGLTYKALTSSIRAYKFKSGKKNKIELSPYAVWNEVTMDNSKKLIEDINPINELKEIESVTLTGGDGISRESVSSKLREYSNTDMGVTSESTVISGDVGINTFLTPHARFKNIRGMIDSSDTSYKDSPEKLLSTSGLLTPAVENDDPKRTNFIAIQNTHVIATPGYSQPLIRTEYEYIVPFRVSPLYAYMALEDGVVIEKTEHTITIQYKDKDKTIVTVPIGLQHGLAEGSCYQHPIVTELSVKSSFKKSDPITYNSNYFEKDWLNKDRLILKFAKNVTTALTLNNEVYEDSSSISAKLSSEMSTKYTKVLSYTIDFSKTIINLLPENSQVEIDSVIFTLLENESDAINLNKDTLKLLSNIANLSPKPKIKGVIDKYEMYYNGDINDMSPSLKKLAKKLNADTESKTKGSSLELTNNKVSDEYRVNGVNLMPEMLELKIYITQNVNAGIGDKFVYGAQLKSVLGDVYSYNLHTEDGKEVDAMYGFKGVAARITLSPYIMGTSNTLLKEVSKQVADLYFK